jgi:hypothetical protein
VGSTITDFHHPRLQKPHLRTTSSTTNLPRKRRRPRIQTPHIWLGHRNRIKILRRERGVVPPALHTSTLRAEGYCGQVVNQAFASITQFHHVPTTKTPLQFIADNSGLTRQLINRRRYTRLRATGSTAQEHELIEPIQNITCTYNNISYHHVKGHQKKKNPSWEAQLDQQCDELATEARHLSKNVKATQLHSAKATIFINLVGVPSNIATQLWHAASNQDLCEYLQNKYEWSTSTIDDIDWTIHSQALKGTYGRAKTAIKKSSTNGYH